MSYGGSLPAIFTTQSPKRNPARLHSWRWYLERRGIGQRSLSSSYQKSKRSPLKLT